MNHTLADEVLSINSIYGDNTLTDVAVASASSDDPAPTNNDNGAVPTTCALQLPSTATSSSELSLRVSFPADYPASAPTILGTQSVGTSSKGAGRAAVDTAAAVLARVFRAGEPCVFDWLEELDITLQQQHEEVSTSPAGPAHVSSGAIDPTAPASATPPQQWQSQPHADKKEEGEDEDARWDGDEPIWALSDAVTEKKSVFLARAARVASPAQARAHVARLVATDRRAARATHNMCAWRIRGVSTAGSGSSGGGGTAGGGGDDGDADVRYQDYDDDGETAAGARLLHLLRLMGARDVLVVVSRWFGGVLLGPDRFRIINAVAREAVVRGGFVGEEGQGKVGEGARKRAGRR